MSAWIVSAAWVSLTVVVPDLTRPQRLQLETAEDRQPQFNRSAIFPLLRNALAWDTPVPRTGATIPDYASIAQDPAGHRGTLFLIEGKLERVVTTGSLAQPGPWEGKLREWDVSVRRKSPVQTAVVFLVDPPADPNRGSRVEIVARFYMIMRRSDEMQDRPTDFPVFVGRTGKVVRTAHVEKPQSRGVVFALLLLVLAFAGVYMVVRRSIRRQPASVTRSPRDGSVPDDIGNRDLHDPLPPRDAADALEEMEQRSHD